MITLPSKFQPRDKVGLQQLIDLLCAARDGRVVKVSFLEGKVKYDLHIPLHGEGNDVRGYFRLANIDAAYVHPPIENDLHYNHLTARVSRGEDTEKKGYWPAD